MFNITMQTETDRNTQRLAGGLRILTDEVVNVKWTAKYMTRWHAILGNIKSYKVWQILNKEEHKLTKDTFIILIIIK
jgi:predicted oxidoreductase